MATVTKQAQEISFTLADRLKLRFSAQAFQETQDTDGNPLLKIGAGSPGGVNAIVKTKAIDFGLVQDVLGATPGYSPYTQHVIQIATEADPTGGSGANILTAQQTIDLLGEVLSKGTQVEWYKSANGVAPTAGAITGVPSATWKDLYFPHAMV